MKKNNLLPALLCLSLGFLFLYFRNKNEEPKKNPVNEWVQRQKANEMIEQQYGYKPKPDAGFKSAEEILDSIRMSNSTRSLEHAADDIPLSKDGKIKVSPEVVRMARTRKLKPKKDSF